MQIFHLVKLKFAMISIREIRHTRQKVLLETCFFSLDSRYWKTRLVLNTSLLTSGRLQKIWMLARLWSKGCLSRIVLWSRGADPIPKVTLVNLAGCQCRGSAGSRYEPKILPQGTTWFYNCHTGMAWFPWQWACRKGIGEWPGFEGHCHWQDRPNLPRQWLSWSYQ